MQRRAEIERKTKETQIAVRVCLDGEGNGGIETGVGFFDHMLDLFRVHSGFDLEVKCHGDVEVDFHHTVEDTGLALGAAILEALGDRVGMERFADRVVPMDDSVALVAVDLGGRPSLLYDVPVSGLIGQFDTELIQEFFRAVANSLKANLYIKALAVGNRHHVAESIFKAFAKCMKDATRLTGKTLPSSKGSL